MKSRREIRRPLECGCTEFQVLVAQEHPDDVDPEHRAHKERAVTFAVREVQEGDFRAL